MIRVDLSVSDQAAHAVLRAVLAVWTYISEGVMPLKRVVLAGLGFLALNGLAYGDSVDFNTAGDLNGKFTINNQTGTAATPGFPGFNQVTSGGIGGGGAVDITAGPSGTLDATAIYNVRSFNLADGPIRLSEAVKILPQYTIGDRLLHMGLIDDTATNHQLNGGAPALADFISARIFPTIAPVAGSPTAAFTYQVQAGQSTGTTATATSNNTATANFNLILGDWYQFTVDISKSATPNTFTVAGFLQDLGADGLTPGATLSFGPENSSGVNTVDLYSDTTVFGAFRGHAAGGGADLYDNFSITQPVPEPASFGLLGLAAMALTSRRKRK
jgi:hypothetical protein